MCQAGFYEKSIPKGKFVSFKIDGSFAKPEGLYDGLDMVGKIKIAHFMQKTAPRESFVT